MSDDADLNLGGAEDLEPLALPEPSLSDVAAGEVDADDDFDYDFDDDFEEEFADEWESPTAPIALPPHIESGGLPPD